MWRLGYLSLWGVLFLGGVGVPCLVLLLGGGGAWEVEWELCSLGGVSASVGFSVDLMSGIFGVCVGLIVSAVFMFGQGYLVGEWHVARITGLLLVFVFSMGLLIFSSGLISVLLGWDGLGLSSFLLVIYYQSAVAAGGGLVTALSNRVGDVAFILGVGGLFFRGDWSSFGSTFGLMGACCVVLGAMTKSAQFPFSAWLPAAMAAPTPVSALVHSSTLVTAGVYVVIRFYSVVVDMVVVRMGLLVLGSITVMLAGLAAFSELDMKKVVAFSTLSQLGLMVISLGLGVSNVAFFHLLTHAMFKALLFICVGCFIYFHEHNQDLRGMGNIVRGFPVISAGSFLASSALCGTPFLAGFYSKDLILEMGLVASMGWGFLFFFSVATALTSAYSVRSVLLGQMGEGFQPSLWGGGDEVWEFWLAIVVLGSVAVFGGAGLNWVLFPSISCSGVSDMLAVLPILFVVGGVYLVSGEWGWVEEVMSGVWFLGELTSHYSIVFPLGLGSKFLALVDQGWLELGSSQGLGLGAQYLSQQVRVVSEQSVMVVLLLGVVGAVPIIVSSF